MSGILNKGKIYGFFSKSFFLFRKFQMIIHHLKMMKKMNRKIFMIMIILMDILLIRYDKILLLINILSLGGHRRIKKQWSARHGIFSFKSS